MSNREDSRAVIPADTLVTVKNCRSLIQNKSTLINIANTVSKNIKRCLSRNEIADLQNFCRVLSIDFYCGKKYDAAIRIISGAYVSEIYNNTDKNVSLEKLSSDGLTIAQQEVAALTPNENKDKFTVFATTTGRPITINNEFKKPKYDVNGIKPDDGEPTDLAYNAVKLVRQTIQFDSRNRLSTANQRNPTYFKWNLHSAGQPGQLGSIRMQDQLQQIIEMEISPFWIPVNLTNFNGYDKIRMLISEFSIQGIIVTEFNDPTLSVPTTSNYHFEFDIVERKIDRVKLEAREPKFRFRKPFAKNFDTFTVRFFTPFGLDIFDNDFGLFSITPGNPTLFTSQVPFNLNTGDLVYVYNSQVPEINRLDGQIITKVSNTQFTIEVNTDGRASESNINVYFASKRVFFQIAFNCLE
jgi:hypothetical protein